MRGRARREARNATRKAGDKGKGRAVRLRDSLAWYRQHRRRILTDRELFALTEPMQRFLAPFKRKRLSLETIKELVDVIASFTKLEVSWDEMKTAYANRTASEIIETKTVFALPEKEMKARQTFVYGCMDYCIALVPCLRALGIPKEAIRFVRVVDQSYLKLSKLWDKTYVIEPTRIQKHRVREYMRSDYNEEQKAQMKHAFAESSGPRAMGISSLKDYAKYAGGY